MKKSDKYLPTSQYSILQGVPDTAPGPPQLGNSWPGDRTGCLLLPVLSAWAPEWEYGFRLQIILPPQLVHFIHTFSTREPGVWGTQGTHTGSQEEESSFHDKLGSWAGTGGMCEELQQVRLGYEDKSRVDKLNKVHSSENNKHNLIFNVNLYYQRMY